MTIPRDTIQQTATPSPGEAAHSMADTVKDEGRAVMETAKGETARLASDARAELHKQGDEQTRRLAERVRDFGNQLEGVQRGEAPSGAVASVVSEAADRANRLAARLDSGGIEAVTADVKQFARRRPGVFLIGAFGLGIVAGRTLRNADTHALVDAAKPSDGAAVAPNGFADGSAAAGASAAGDPGELGKLGTSDVGGTSER
jgi:hypothetical protein